MSFLNQMKLAQDMMKNMSPEQMQEMMKQAQDSKQMLAEEIKKAVEEEIKNRGLVTKEEVEEMIKNYPN